ncbi:hypothetical protein M378DRAFT_673418 [Amanita muscaria Koide BX008]|uniref:Uncharacterized protein n=1 Tax=Amanita muscaria (strain Koide BX008) TaxID=946122 RepID=A0A0C2W195_AMAMK|nr:hypothetical protein M378DRAFT_673418 [Amanita muscaria Koide BX008]
MPSRHTNHQIDSTQERRSASLAPLHQHVPSGVCQESSSLDLCRRRYATSFKKLCFGFPPLGLSTMSNGSALTPRTNMAWGNPSIDEGNSIIGEEERSCMKVEIEGQGSTVHGSFYRSLLSVSSPGPLLNSLTLRQGTYNSTETGEDGSGDEEGNLGHERRTRPAPGTPPSLSNPTTRSCADVLSRHCRSRCISST